MKMTTKKTWEFPDVVYKGDLPKEVLALGIERRPKDNDEYSGSTTLHVHAGTYEVERVERIIVDL